MNFHYRVTFTGYIRCFCATTSHDLVILTFWPWQCIVYTVPHMPDPHTNYPAIIGYWVMNYRIWSHICYREKVTQCACAVSRDLCIRGRAKPHVTIFLPRIACSLYNFYGATKTIKGSLQYIGACYVKAVFHPPPRKKLSPVKIGSKMAVFGNLRIFPCPEKRLLAYFSYKSVQGSRM